MKIKLLHFSLWLLALAVDLLIADLVLITLLKAGRYELSDLNSTLAVLLVLTIWFLVIRPLLLSILGFTFGTWLLKIKTANQIGGKPNFLQALTPIKNFYENIGILRVAIALAIVLAFYGFGYMAVMSR